MRRERHAQVSRRRQWKHRPPAHRQPEAPPTTAEVACVSASGRMLSAEETAATVQLCSISDAVAWGADLAVIASPAPFHLDHAAALLEAGVPVLIEKPLSDSRAAYDALAPRLVAHRDRIEVAYNLRYLSSSQCMKGLIQRRRVGRLHAIRIDIGQYLPDCGLNRTIGGTSRRTRHSEAACCSN